MHIETLQLPSVMDADRFGDLSYFVRHTAFIIPHKSEPVDTLLTLLRYLPADSPRIIVTNCAPGVLPELTYELGERLTSRDPTYLVHQKDERVAHFFRECGVPHILDASGTVVDGKGEGMYIGTILAALLGIAEWVVYFDADNYAPSALLEYTLAMGQLFMPPANAYPLGRRSLGYPERAPLHNVRVCWASKPTYDGVSFAPQPPILATAAHAERGRARDDHGDSHGAPLLVGVLNRNVSTDRARVHWGPEYPPPAGGWAAERATAAVPIRQPAFPREEGRGPHPGHDRRKSW